MIDYHANYVALAELTASLQAAGFSDPALSKAKQSTLKALKSHDAAALLGAFVHHLVNHAAADGTEMALIENGSDLWAKGVALCTQLGSIRAHLEAALADPSLPGAADQFNTAAVNAQTLANNALALRTEVENLRIKITSFGHLPPHPRQSDLPTPQWRWGDLQAGRRTDALVRALFKHAKDDVGLAFAVGADSAYGANVVASSYLGQAVGGPRRNHRFRDRLARNAVGSWLALNHPSATTPTKMSQRIGTFGQSLPQELKALLSSALSDTFDLNHTKPLPDLDRGYQRLVHHLQLLDTFVVPPIPTPPAQSWLALQYGATGSSTTPGLHVLDASGGLSGTPGGGLAYGPGGDTPGSSDSGGSGTGTCLAILALILILADVIQAFVQCIVQWAKKQNCTFWDNMLLSDLWKKDPPDPREPTNTGSDQESLTAVAGQPEAAALVGILFNIHTQLWDGLQNAYSFLSLFGIIYPGPISTMPVYAQFTALPSPQGWPHREDAQPLNTFHLYPTASLEHPTVAASQFPVGAHPNVCFAPTPNGASGLSMQLWTQVMRGVSDSLNLDLDADRGAMGACWTSKGSVQQDPISVVTLQYSQQ